MASVHGDRDIEQVQFSFELRPIPLGTTPYPSRFTYKSKLFSDTGGYGYGGAALYGEAEASLIECPTVLVTPDGTPAD